MRLENLYKNFGTSTPEEQVAFISAYRLHRASDLVSTSETKTTSRTKRFPDKTSIFDVSEEEKALMKILGLKMKDVATLRALQEEDTKDTDDVELLRDSLFEGEEED